MDNYQGWGSSFYAPQTPISTNVTAPTGKIEADYDLTKANMIYASLSSGYKPGGINGGTAGSEVVKSTFDKETVVSYEVGSKNRFLDNHLNVNMSAFYAMYSNMQYIQEDPIPYHGGIGNIPKVDMWGAEVEAKYRMLDDRLELGGNLTALAGKIPEDYLALDRRLADAAAAASGLIPYTPAWFAVRAAQTIDVKGNAPPNMPGLAGAVSASWLQSITGHGELTSRVEYLFRGRYESRVFNEPGVDDVPSYGQVNLFFEYVPDGQPWKASFSVTNLLNTAGVVGRYVDPYGSGVVSNQYIPPRQFLLSMNYKF
jgi:iron complex outermembrane receptor protein